jgi:hypothetical protein
MKLNEILGSPAEYKVIRNTPKTFEAEFTSGGRLIRFSALMMHPQFFEISFAEITKNPNGSEYEATKKTGNGKEFEVFATVKAILEHFIKEYKPQQMNLDSHKGEASRTKLYQRLISKNLPAGWKMERDESHPSYITFALTKV